MKRSISAGESAIISPMFLRLACVLASVCVFVPGALARPFQSPIVIDQDIRVFTIVAALNVAGFDVELASQYHPVRAEIRRIAEGLDPSLVRKMREFYASHRPSGVDEDQLAKYISLAVAVTDPPNFKPSGREESLPDDARSVLGFVPLLQEFYQKGGVARLWAKVAPAYEAEMDRLGPSIRTAIARTDSYLRAASAGALSTQTMKIVVELGAPQNSVNVRSHQDDYYVVLGYAATPKVEEIRHAYLHLRLNNYATAAASKVESRAGLMTLLFGASGVQREYANNFENMLTESLVRAVELRLDRGAPAAAREESLRGFYRSGLLLAPYFHESLIAYEAGENTFREEIGLIAAAIDLPKEQERFETTFRSIPAPQRQNVRAEVPVAPAPDPVFELLRTAEAAFEKDKGRAREIFEKVLNDHNPNEGRALYGIGLIEMDKGDEASLDRALQYFERTIKSDSADRSMRTWSYIYSGHILDYKCNRAAALENYRKAVETGDNTRNAQSTARRDLEKPFVECRQ
jgi:hypothetical protein